MRPHILRLIPKPYRISRRFISQLQNKLVIDQTELKKDLEEPLISHLNKRGLLASITSDELEGLLAKTKLGLYCGADPTAKSLHLGNLLPLMILLH